MKAFFKKIFERLTRDLDNPEPIVYEKQAALVWAQVDKTLRTAHAEFEHTRIHIDYSDHQPPKGKPLEIQATIDLNHPELRSVKGVLPDEEQDLRSTIVLKAHIEPLEAKKSQLTLNWKTKTLSVSSRSKHDKLIIRITELIDENITKAE